MIEAVELVVRDPERVGGFRIGVYQNRHTGERFLYSGPAKSFYRPDDNPEVIIIQTIPDNSIDPDSPTKLSEQRYLTRNSFTKNFFHIGMIW